MSLVQMRRDLVRNRQILDVMSTTLREQERLMMHSVLGVSHEFSAWSHETQREVIEYYEKDNRFTRFLAFLLYIRYGRTFVFGGSPHLGLSNIVLKDSIGLEDLPVEVVNSMWLHMVLRRKRASAKGLVTKSERKRARGGSG